MARRRRSGDKTAKRKMTPPADSKRCTVVKVSGERCKCARMTGKDVCWAHGGVDGETRAKACATARAAKVELDEARLEAARYRAAMLAELARLNPMTTTDEHRRHLNGAIAEAEGDMDRRTAAQLHAILARLNAAETAAAEQTRSVNVYLGVDGDDVGT